MTVDKSDPEISLAQQRRWDVNSFPIFVFFFSEEDKWAQPKQNIFYGALAVLAELDRMEEDSDIDSLLESDSCGSYNSAKEELFISGEDIILDRYTTQHFTCHSVL